MPITCTSRAAQLGAVLGQRVKAAGQPTYAVGADGNTHIVLPDTDTSWMASEARGIGDATLDATWLFPAGRAAAKAAPALAKGYAEMKLFRPVQAAAGATLGAGKATAWAAGVPGRLAAWVGGRAAPSPALSGLRASRAADGLRWLRDSRSMPYAVADRALTVVPTAIGVRDWLVNRNAPLPMNELARRVAVQKATQAKIQASEW